MNRTLDNVLTVLAVVAIVGGVGYLLIWGCYALWGVISS